MPNQNPIFVYALYRSCSTWWWKQFRDAEGYRAYSEPLHYRMEDITREEVLEMSSDDFKKVTDSLNHPETEKHYFAEFPINEDGGVPLYEPRFAKQNYVLEKDDEDEALEKYILDLIEYANDQDECPVLQFNRAYLRMGFLKDKFPDAKTIYLHRDVSDVYHSCLSYMEKYVERGIAADRASSFLAYFVEIIGQNKAHPWFKTIAKHYGIKGPQKGTYKEIQTFYQEQTVHLLEQGAVFDIFYYISERAHAEANKYADLIIDVTQLADDLDYRTKIADAFYQLSGVEAYLDGYRYKSYDEKLKPSGTDFY